MSNSRIEPHGGQISNRMVTEERIRELKQDFVHLQSWTLNDRQICDLEMIMNGGFSPLIGFLDQKDYDAVCTGMRHKIMTSGPFLLPWMSRKILLKN